MQNNYFQLCLWFQRACSGKLAAVNFIVNITSVNSNKSFFLSITKDVPFIFSLFNQFIALSIDRKWVDRCIGRRHLGRNVICITRAISSKVVNCLPDIRFATFNRFFLFTIISNWASFRFHWKWRFNCFQVWMFADNCVYLVSRIIKKYINVLQYSIIVLLIFRCFHEIVNCSKSSIYSNNLYLF